MKCKVTGTLQCAGSQEMWRRCLVSGVCSEPRRSTSSPACSNAPAPTTECDTSSLMDRGVIEIDAAHRRLAREVAPGGRVRLQAVE